ncbi:MAG: helix-hairpin-helix domain-containing protein, partial [Candidatus Thorarchaeota archaeon]|nr:helix-hairpin-helix domain-containing protein [Candidatus Thorarchaeota archaeon]
ITPDIEFLYVMMVFAGLVVFLMSWTIQLNKTVVVKFRGRIVGLFLALSLCFYFIGVYIADPAVSLLPTDFPLPEVVGVIGIAISIGNRPWKLPRYPLAVKDSAFKYFIPMALLLAAHILWYFSTAAGIRATFELATTPISDSLLTKAQFDLATDQIGLLFYQLTFIISGTAVSGYLADSRGRKMAFSTAVLIFGFLSIFGEVFYFVDDAGHQVLHALPLLASERFIEGYLLGLCLLLIWTELGAAKRKGLRLSLAWLFFTGYMGLFFAAKLGVPLGYPPAWVGDIGGPFSVFFSLVALWQIGALPEILGREIEMEDFALDIDQKQVDKTVAAFLRDEDFESIKSQLDVIDAAEEMSDKELSEFLGRDLQQILPLRRIKGVGSALEEKLRKAGYESAAQLAGETAKRLSSKIDGLTEKQAERILQDARDAVKELAKKANSRS